MDGENDAADRLLPATAVRSGARVSGITDGSAPCPGSGCSRYLARLLSLGLRDDPASFLAEALEETGWNIVDASRRLEVARSHLYALIRAFGIERAKR